jgi:hypothetical protein
MTSATPQDIDLTRTTIVLPERRGLREMTRQTTILPCLNQNNELALAWLQKFDGEAKFPWIQLQRCLNIMCPITTMDIHHMLRLTASYSWIRLKPEISQHNSLPTTQCRTTTGTTTNLSMEMKKSSCELWIKMTSGLRMANSHMRLAEPQVRHMNGWWAIFYPRLKHFRYASAEWFSRMWETYLLWIHKCRGQQGHWAEDWANSSSLLSRTYTSSQDGSLKLYSSTCFWTADQQQLRPHWTYCWQCSCSQDPGFWTNSKGTSTVDHHQWTRVF